MGPSQISDTPFQGYCHYYFSNIHISNTHPNWTLISVNIIYIYINNVAVSCKRYPQVYHISLLYKRVVKKCGCPFREPRVFETAHLIIMISHHHHHHHHHHLSHKLTNDEL